MALNLPIAPKTKINIKEGEKEEEKEKEIEKEDVKSKPNKTNAKKREMVAS